MVRMEYFGPFFCMHSSSSFFDWLLDGLAAVSLVGIWPRFIEPFLLFTTELTLFLPNLPVELEGLKLLQFSDLHWHHSFSRRFAKKIFSKIRSLQPDLIVFTGDFLCRSQLQDPQELCSLLQSCSAPLGCFAVLGNHDYARYVSVDSMGRYAEIDTAPSSHTKRGWKSLFLAPMPPTGASMPHLQHIPPHPELVELLQDTPFRLLRNETIAVQKGSKKIQITGLEEYSLGRLSPETAFEGYDPDCPGIVLCHNPDAFPLLHNYPGDLLLAGHTHGAQLNLPLLRQRFLKLENPQWRRSLHRIGHPWAYINRGIGGLPPLRCFSPPELTLFHLQRQKIQGDQ